MVIPLYLKHGREFPNLLRGMFSFVLYDARDDRCAASPSSLIAMASPPWISSLLDCSRPLDPLAASGPDPALCLCLPLQLPGGA